MDEIVILSGKGGTGKTSLTAAFAHLSSKHIICDLDVDAPDLHLLLNPEMLHRETFISGHEAIIAEERCENCGLCSDVCRYDAVSMKNGFPYIDPLRCEGCKVCVTLCPNGAIDFPERTCGNWYISDTRFGPMVHAQLYPGEENSGLLVSLLRKKAREIAEEKQIRTILADGTPGIGCPVIASLSGTSLAVIVTEPTPSGRHDLDRITDLCEHFKIPTAVIVNKYDLNTVQTEDIEADCRRKNIIVLGRIPHDDDITHAMVAGKTITEFSSNGIADDIKNIWKRIESLAVETKKE